MTFLQILLLGIVQGAAELLPVSSSAHVIVAEKLMGLDPSSPEMTFMLVMLHTGTMFAVIAYFWKAWSEKYFSSAEAFRRIAILALIATALTGVVGMGIKHLIEKFFLRGGDIEELFGNMPMVASALAVGGLLIIYAGRRSARTPDANRELDGRSAAWIGVMQGLCLPFRGFSRSGATISAGLIQGINRVRMEEFSFALAVILTPPVVGRGLLRLLKTHGPTEPPLHLASLLMPGMLGMVCSFAAGLLALKFLSRLLENGRWTFFGYYCLAASAGVFLMNRCG